MPQSRWPLRSSRVLHVDCPQDIPTVQALAEGWIEDLPAEWEAQGGPSPAISSTRQSTPAASLGGDGPVRLLHGDFHYANVLAGRRAPWLAIDPKPLAGDPAFDVAPLLRNRWEALTCTGRHRRRAAPQIRPDHRGVGTRPRTDEAWVVTRAVDNVLWATDKRDPAFADVERTIAETFSR